MWKCSGLLLLLALTGCERYPSGGDLRLHNDMVNQPSFRPQRDPLLPAEGAVPKTGIEPAISREAAMRDLQNPFPQSTDSLTREARLYAIYCYHCHGIRGRGNGPVAAKISQPADLTTPKYAKASDGLFYYTIRYGTPIMPALAEALSPEERWRIVNHVRRLQNP